MSIVKRTTRDIIGDYIDNEALMSHIEKTDDYTKEQFEEYVKVKKDLQREVQKKVDNVDHYVLEVSRKEHLIDAEVEALTSEIERLKNRKRSIGVFKSFVNEILLPMVITEVGKDGVWETDVARYKMYETFGKVVIDPETVHNDFKKVEIKESIDRSKARKAAMAAYKKGKDMPEGISISKVTRIRRT